MPRPLAITVALLGSAPPPELEEVLNELARTAATVRSTKRLLRAARSYVERVGAALPEAGIEELSRAMRRIVDAAYAEAYSATTPPPATELYLKGLNLLDMIGAFLARNPAVLREIGDEVAVRELALHAAARIGRLEILTELLEDLRDLFRRALLLAE